MSRVPQIASREDVQADKRDVFDEIAKSRGKVAGPFSVLINSPEIARRAADLGAYIRFESSLTSQEIELATLTASRAFNSSFEWGAHVKLGRAAGLREEAIQAIGNNGPLDELSDSESLIIRYGRELFREHKVSDETFSAAKSKFGDQGIVELTVTMGYYGMLAVAMNAFEVEPPQDWPKLP